MKKILVFFIFFNILLADSILKKSTNLIAKQKGVIFIFDSKTCSYCDLLKKDFSENKKLQKISKDFNIYLIDKDIETNYLVGALQRKESTTTLINTFMVKSSPNIIIFDKKWNKVFQLPGYINPEQLIIFMNFVHKVNTKKEKLENWIEYLQKHGV